MSDASFKLFAVIAVVLVFVFFALTAPYWIYYLLRHKTLPEFNDYLVEGWS